ncbi:MAG: 2-amino-4-hydroxy-6-hydroxymethyldihydropteridine diphosphokinase [Treponema sp.]|uniref:2-amino-4-hydroxy-6- hydroxymethyldihydropteridine diphosphokinase n=1 Tax=Treponema sp. TaxID=166 RepID=UPI0026003CF2|nr:2-amino-4-hydroxy-6-hydroxymethyldihydropteridine diphosphokinase [Treponema sp.]MBQ9282400.1 2-amino-4-hydroxy-6-hydroxymethyldihydropteridine diphosphokinase [Treponema sp.]
MFAVLGLGSNKAFDSLDSLHVLACACVELESLFSDFCVSSVYRTKPMYVENQPDFFNMAVSGETTLSASGLLSKIHEIEASFGRSRENEIRNGQRSLDIDIELFGNEEIHFSDPVDSMKNLEIPHPRISERAFVLIPLLEVLPESAEIQNRDFYEKSLAKTGNQGAELYLDSAGFAGIITETERSYGRTGTDNGKSGDE